MLSLGWCISGLEQTATRQVPKPTSLEQPRRDHAAFSDLQQQLFGPKDVLPTLGIELIERRTAASPGQGAGARRGHAGVQDAGMLLGVELTLKG